MQLMFFFLLFGLAKKIYRKKYHVVQHLKRAILFEKCLFGNMVLIKYMKICDIFQLNDNLRKIFSVFVDKKCIMYMNLYSRNYIWFIKILCVRQSFSFGYMTHRFSFEFYELALDIRRTFIRLVFILVTWL